MIRFFFLSLLIVSSVVCEQNRRGDGFSTEYSPAEGDKRSATKAEIEAIVTKRMKKSFPKEKPMAMDWPFPVDFNTTASSLRTRILQADVQAAAKILTSMRIIGLGDGLTYTPECQRFVTISEDRNKDPDVVAFKAVAQAALETRDPRRLATVLILSLHPDCQCSIYDSEEQDDLINEFAAEFEDEALLKRIVNADANRELNDLNMEMNPTAGRSPVSSFTCANCWPKRSCRKLRWCKRRRLRSD